ncbi:MAG: restriction endonuclease subunit S, partial [Anaerolineales bacterium]|nr:restriction endonuclease subunit S [Anaerolineales bacterium]
MKRVKLGDICEINPRRTNGVNSNVLCSFIPMEYVDEYLGAVTRTSLRQVSEVEKGYTSFQNGDVLFAKITPCMENGKCAIAKNLANGIGFGSTEFHVIRAREKVIPEWVYYYLRQGVVRKEAERNMTGSAGQKRVPSRFLEEAQLPLPPLDEQKRIAAIL